MKKILLLLIPVALFSCELVVDVDQPPFEPSIVVGSFIGPDTTVLVNLTEDRYVLENTFEFDPITGATVQLFEDDRLIGTLDEVAFNFPWDRESNVPGYYGLDFRPEEGRHYRLEVSKDGFQSVQATDQLPVGAPRFEVLRVTESEFGDSEFEIRIFDEPGDDYYEVLAFISTLGRYVSYDGEGNILEDSTWRDDPYAVSIYSENIAIEEYNNAIFNDRLFEGRTYDLEMEGYFSFSGDFYEYDLEPILTIEVRRLSEAYFNYVNSSALQDWVSGDPFAQPVQAYTNVENGRGVLGSYTSTKVEVEL